MATHIQKSKEVWKQWQQQWLLINLCNFASMAADGDKEDFGEKKRCVVWTWQVMEVELKQKARRCDALSGGKQTQGQVWAELGVTCTKPYLSFLWCHSKKFSYWEHLKLIAWNKFAEQLSTGIYLGEDYIPGSESTNELLINHLGLRKQ